MDDFDFAGVDSPEKALNMLRRLAQRFYEDQSELQSAWQDPQAGRFWGELAKRLERAADQCEKFI